MTKVMVGVPIHRPIEFKVFESFMRMTNRRTNILLEFSMISSSLVYDAREYIASEFLKSDCEYLMFIDSDMTFHPQSIEFLVKHDKEFVTAKAFKRVKPYQPCFYTKVNIDEGSNQPPYLETPVGYGEGLLPIEGAGLACALIKRSAFEKINAPYFFPLPHVGEDLTFCNKLKNAGVKMFCDTTLQFGHLAHKEVFEQDFYEEYKKEVDNANKKDGDSS
jgi:GT2 family glycosyltransferase